MLTVPIVVAYTAEMLLYRRPVNAIIIALIGVDFKPAWLANPQIALLTVALLEIWNWTPFSFIIMLGRPGGDSQGADRSGGNSRRLQMADLLGGAVAAAAAGHSAGAGAALPRGMAEFPKTWALFQGGPGSATETIPVYIYLDTWQYFQISKGAAMSYVVMMMMVVIVLIAINLLRREKRALDAMYADAPSDGRGARWR